MVFTVNPIQAVGFIIFLVLLQQLEGNLIYPRVVGSSIGLPKLPGSLGSQPFLDTVAQEAVRRCRQRYSQEHSSYAQHAAANGHSRQDPHARKADGRAHHLSLIHI